jgi:predicted dehydrogenase
LLNDSNVNAVYVSTPPGTHYNIAMQCLSAGKPTYLEKPVARSAADTRSIVEAFNKAGVPLFVAYYRRGQQRFQRENYQYRLYNESRNVCHA